MATRERASAAYQRAIDEGLSALTPEERALYTIQNFVVEFEGSGLSGYLYNTLPELESIDRTVAVMRQHGLEAAARVLEDAASLFRTYVDPDPPTTWGAVLSHYDPHDELSKLDAQMGEVLDW